MRSAAAALLVKALIAYVGRDAQVTAAMRAWMLGRDFPREIP